MIALPTTAAIVLVQAVEPALKLLPPHTDSPEARVMILAIMGQESNLRTRKQDNDGPARGLAQFENGNGGIRGVLMHHTTSQMARRVCEARGIIPNEATVYAALEKDDILAAAFARLLLWTDPYPLPPVGDSDAAWRLYIRTWKPGRPRPEHWMAHYLEALNAVRTRAGETDGPV